MDRDFSFGGQDFKLSKINALKQYHLIRRIGPVLSELLPALKESAKLKEGDIDSLPEGEKLELAAKFVTPIVGGLSKLNDADAEFVLMQLLCAVEMRQSTGNWAKVSNGQMIMLQELELPALMNLAGRAFMFNLTGFFAVLPR